MLHETANDGTASRNENDTRSTAKKSHEQIIGDNTASRVRFHGPNKTENIVNSFDAESTIEIPLMEKRFTSNEHNEKTENNRTSNRDLDVVVDQGKLKPQKVPMRKKSGSIATKSALKPAKQKN